jgi:hypothetical protein
MSEDEIKALEDASIDALHPKIPAPSPVPGTTEPKATEVPPPESPSDGDKDNASEKTDHRPVLVPKKQP